MACLREETNQGREKGPARREKRGSVGGLGYLEKRDCRARMGQALSLVGEITMVTPFPNGSVFERGRRRDASPFENWIEPREGWRRCELWFQVSHVSSPARRKPLKATVKAAHKLTWS
jgi:hypothetical protein